MALRGSQRFEPVPSRLLGKFSGQLLSFEWRPSPEEVEREFIALANYYEGVAGPLAASLEVLRRDTQKRFHTETDPDNVQWQELSPDYLEDKLNAGYPDSILYREGFLYEQAPDGWEVMGDTIIYNPSVLPRAKSDGANYGMAHQDGSGYRGLTIEGWVEGGHIGEDFPEIGRGMNLPRRQFIGMSLDALEDIVAIFEAWFDAGLVGFENVQTFNLTEFAHTPPGARTPIIQSRIGGRFGPRIG